MQSAMVDAIESAKAAGYIKTKWFHYNRTETNVISNVTTQDVFQISNVSDFLWYYLSGSVFRPAGTPIPAPDILVSLFDQQQGWQVSDNPVHWMTLVGTAQNPYILPDPRLIPEKNQITMQLFNQNPLSYTQVNVTFGGLLVYYFGGFTRAELPIHEGR